VLSVVLLEPSECIKALVDDTSVHPSGRKPAQICSLSGFILAFLFKLFLGDQSFPSRINSITEAFESV
jgi:hypothetical protein